MVRALDLAVKLYLVIVAMDVLLAWVQPDPRRLPRVVFHRLTEPIQRPLRRACRLRGWDLSPLVVIGLLGVVRVFLVQA